MYLSIALMSRTSPFTRRMSRELTPLTVFLAAAWPTTLFAILFRLINILVVSLNRATTCLFLCPGLNRKGCITIPCAGSQLVSAVWEHHSHLINEEHPACGTQQALGATWHHTATLHQCREVSEHEKQSKLMSYRDHKYHTLSPVTYSTARLMLKQKFENHNFGLQTWIPSINYIRCLDWGFKTQNSPCFFRWLHIQCTSFCSLYSEVPEILE